MEDLVHTWSDKAFVKHAFSSMHVGSPEITLTVPLNGVVKFIGVIWLRNLSSSRRLLKATHKKRRKGYSYNQKTQELLSFSFWYYLHKFHDKNYNL